MANEDLLQHQNRFFFRINLLLALLVLVGFAPSFYLQPGAVSQTFPAHLIWHGVLLSLWYAWVVVQVCLVRIKRPDLHRASGVVGALIGALAVYAGPRATIGSIERLRARGLAWDSNMAEYPALGIEIMNLDQYTRSLVWTNFAATLCFALLLSGAIYWRRQSPIHARLITLASIVFIAPALARISHWPYLGGEDSPFMPLCFLLLLLSLVLYDRRVLGRVHPATLSGIALIVVANSLAMAVAFTAPGQSVVRSLAIAG
jgi:hypothetical protein